MKPSRGFLTFAQNNNNIDYLNLAFVQALNIKLTQNNYPFAVIVDNQTYKTVTDLHRLVFDHIIILQDEYENKFSNEVFAYNLTPFDETIKIESDLLFTRNIEHWWDILNNNDLIISYGTKTYKQTTATNRFYRMIFDSNFLPDLYTGLIFFKKTLHAKNYYDLTKVVNDNWAEIRDKRLRYCNEIVPSTDVLFSVTAKLYGIENCSIKTLEFFNFVHMKNMINDFGDSSEDWTKIVPNEIDYNFIRINNLNQYYPVHYFCKNFITEEIKNEYLQRYLRQKLARTYIGL